MKWFKHISDSLDDPYIFSLLSDCGSDGYLVFFGILEIYSREFSPELDWKLCVTRAYLRQKLVKRQDTLVMKCLKHIQKSGKWEIDIKDEEIIIHIPKFKAILDDWTSRKLRSNPEVSPGNCIVNKNKIKKKKQNKNNIENTPSQIAKQFFIDNLNSQDPIIKEFVKYWTEPNKLGTQQRWELQKTFELNRRLDTWRNNDFNYKKNNR